MHTLIVGAQGAGKTTLIRRLLAELDRPVFGFLTVKEDDLTADERGAPIYIYDATGERVRTQDNLVGYCANRCATIITEGFERFAPRLAGGRPDDSVVVMDEIGFMESQADAFREAIMARLDGATPVIAAVRDKDTPFLKAVRTHPNCRCFWLTEENRDEIFREASDFFRAQLEGAEK